MSIRIHTQDPLFAGVGDYHVNFNRLYVEAAEVAKLNSTNSSTTFAQRERPISDTKDI